MVRIAYIAGCARSGTTLLARLLGELPGFVSIGEAGSYFFLNDRHTPDLSAQCGCGADTSKCSFWSSIVRDQQLKGAARPFARYRYVHRAFLWNPVAHSDLQNFLAHASEFYHKVAELAGATVVVDSSKSPQFAALLALAPNVEVHIVHLIRDLRGVVSSERVPKSYLPAAPPWRTILNWYMANACTELLLKRQAGSFSQLRYDEFLYDPSSILERLAFSITGFQASNACVREGKAYLRPQHFVLGNPDKFQTGDTILRECKPKLSVLLNVAVSLVGAPLLLRYGFLSKRNGHNARERGLTSPSH